MKSNWLINIEKIVEAGAIHQSRVIGVSDHLMNTILTRHPFAKPIYKEVLPNDIISLGCDSSVLPRVLQIAVVGILEPRKNHKFILRLFEGLTIHNWALNFFGVGPQKQFLMTLVRKLDLADKVNFMGWVDREKIWPNVNILLSPSLHEGMPNAVLEAISAGVPVMASDIPAHRDLLPSNQLFSLDDMGTWREALFRVLEAPEPVLSSMARSQRQHAAHLSFDWDSAVVRVILSS